MRKGFCIIILIVLSVSLFATDTTLNLKLTINNEQEPTFKFSASTDENFATEVEQGNTLTLSGDTLDLLTNDVTVYFKVSQTNIAHYTGNIKVTYSATPFRATLANGSTYEATVHHIRMHEQLYVDKDLHFKLEPVDGPGYTFGEPCAFIFKYDDTKTPVPAVPLQGIAVVWNKNENLPVAEYTATVSVQFETI